MMSFAEMEKHILNFIWNLKGPQIVSAGEVGSVLDIDGGDNTTLRMYLIPLKYILKGGKGGKFCAFYHNKKNNWKQNLNHWYLSLV